MELLISNIKAKGDIKLISELVERLGLKISQLTLEEKEDIGLALAIKEGSKSGHVPEATVIKTLRNISKKK